LYNKGDFVSAGETGKKKTRQSLFLDDEKEKEKRDGVCFR